MLCRNLIDSGKPSILSTISLSSWYSLLLESKILAILPFSSLSTSISSLEFCNFSWRLDSSVFIDSISLITSSICWSNFSFCSFCWLYSTARLSKKTLDLSSSNFKLSKLLVNIAIAFSESKMRRSISCLLRSRSSWLFFAEECSVLMLSNFDLASSSSCLWLLNTCWDSVTLDINLAISVW